MAQKPIPAEEGGGVETFSFAEMAGGDEAAPVQRRPVPHIPYLPSPAVRGAGGDGNKLPSPSGRGAGGEGLVMTTKRARRKRMRQKTRPLVKAGRHAKPKTASKESDEKRVPPRVQADRAAAQAIDGIDPYDPAGFNNQADAPTEMTTPAARRGDAGAVMTHGPPSIRALCAWRPFVGQISDVDGGAFEPRFRSIAKTPETSANAPIRKPAPLGGVEGRSSAGLHARCPISARRAAYAPWKSRPGQILQLPSAVAGG